MKSPQAFFKNFAKQLPHITFVRLFVGFFSVAKQLTFGPVVAGLTFLSFLLTLNL